MDAHPILFTNVDEARTTETHLVTELETWPYAVEVSRTHSEKLHFRMFAGPSGGREVAVGEADMKTFVNGLADQSRKLLDECRLREWWSADAKALALHLHDLDRELASGR